MNRSLVVAVLAGMLAAGACLPTCGTSSNACSSDGDCAFIQECRDGTCTNGVLANALPPLPAEAGDPGAVARIITSPADLLTGNAAQGALGDVLMSNGQARFIIQKPGRDFGVAMFGGNPIDAVAVQDGVALPDEFGEVMPFLNLGMAVDFTEVQVVRTGARGGPAVVRAYGRPALWDFINLAGFLAQGFTAAVLYNPDEPLGFKVVATYELHPNESVLRVTCTLLNQEAFARSMPVGVTMDSGGVVEFFRSRGGFGTPRYDPASILDAARPVPWFGFMGERGASALRPRPLDDAADPTADTQNPTVQVAGVTVSLFSRPDVLNAIAESDFVVDPGSTRSFGYDLAVGSHGMGRAGAALWKAQGKALRKVVFTATQEGSTQGVPDVLVVVRGVDSLNAAAEPITAQTTDAQGRAELELPADATVVLQFRADGRRVPDPVTLTPADTSLSIQLPRPGALSYQVTRTNRLTSSAQSQGACRITVVGADQVTDPVTRAARGDRPPGDVSAVRYSPNCQSSEDGAIPLLPGRYLVVATAGPAFDAVQQLVDVGEEGALFTGTLHRVVDAGPYIASDWHQHSVNSPDAPVALRDRLVSYLAEGIELFGGSDHDYFTDWETLVAAYGFADRVQAINGVESTTFDYGHFNMFPVTRDDRLVNGGPVDWAGGAGPGLAPPQLWQRYRDRGVQVVQVNHPLGGQGGYFTRSAMTFEVDRTAMTGTVRGDPARQPVSNETLRLPPLEPLWSTAFDAVEVYNGMRPYSGTPVTRLPGDRTAERILSLVGTLIHVGHRPVMTGTSDTHRLNSGDQGYPRTYVRAPRLADGRADLWGVLGALAGLGGAENRGDVVASNGPVPLVVVQSGTQRVTPGGVLRASGLVDVHVTVTTPSWMELSGTDVVFAPLNETQTFPDGAPPFTPVGATAFTRVEKALQNGGRQLEWTARVTLDVAALNPFAGRDTFFMVRVYGATPLWPVVMDNLSLGVDENAATVEDFVTVLDGISAYAVTNPVYLDVDGDGRFRGALEP